MMMVRRMTGVTDDGDDDEVMTVMMIDGDEVTVTDVRGVSDGDEMRCGCVRCDG